HRCQESMSMRTPGIRLGNQRIVPPSSAGTMKASIPAWAPTKLQSRGSRAYGSASRLARLGRMPDREPDFCRRCADLFVRPDPDGVVDLVVRVVQILGTLLSEHITVGDPGVVEELGDLVVGPQIISFT